MAYHYIEKDYEVSTRDWASGMLFVGLILAAVVVSMAASVPGSLITQVTAGVMVTYVVFCTYLISSKILLK